MSGDQPAQSPNAEAEFAGADVEGLVAEIKSLRQRLDAAERALAEERCAFAHWRNQAKETISLELSPQALDNLAQNLSKRKRRENRLGRFLRFFRTKK